MTKIDLPFIPTSSDEFMKLLGDFIWNDWSKPTASGGIICGVSHWYDDWHDARDVAAAAGAKPLYSNHMDGEAGRTWQFPNGDRVFISSTGGMASPARWKHRVGAGRTK